ncbi:MAG: HEAT repeat domain-containing protein [Candidatus Binatia bacterium]
MRRRLGDAGYALVVAAAFTIQAVALAAAVIMSLSGRWDVTARTVTAIIVTAGAAAAGLLVLAMYTIAYQTLGTRRDLRHTHDVMSWMDRFIDVLFSGTAPPHGPLPRAATDALLDLRESVRGQAAAAIDELITDYGIDTELISRVGLPRETTTALEGLARARSPEAIPTLMTAAMDPDPTARNAAVRALARSASTIPDGHDRAKSAHDIAELLLRADLSSSAVDEALQLLDEAAPDAIDHILGDAGRFGPRLVCAALDAIGRLGLAQFIDTTATFADHRRIAVRAAAIRAMSELGRIPAHAMNALRAALHDRNDVVRIEAARAARLLDPAIAVPALKSLIEDPAWSVRRTAAASLASLGDYGRSALVEAALEHHDPQVRSAAGAVLMERRIAVHVPEDAR